MRLGRSLPLLLLLGLGGCNVIGALASKVPKPDVDAAYKKLSGQTVGVMVWADRALLLDWPTLQIDAGNALQNKLLIAQQNDVKDLKGTTFPYPPASFIKYQKEHPEIEAQPITEVAGKLGVKRLIYVEINDLSTCADGGSTLYLGNITATLRIIEINDKGVGTVGYAEENIKATFPDKAPKEGVLNATDHQMYAGAVYTLTTEIVTRLIQHPADDDDN